MTFDLYDFDEYIAAPTGISPDVVAHASLAAAAQHFEFLTPVADWYTHLTHA